MGVAFQFIGRGGGAPVLDHSGQDLQVEDWPTVPDHWLEDAMARLSPDDIDRLLRDKIFPYCWMPDHTIHGVVHGAAAQVAAERDLRVVGRVRVECYRRLIQSHLSRTLLAVAVNTLARQRPWASARQRLTFAQMQVGAVLLTGLMAGFVLLPLHAAISMLMILAGGLFTFVVALRCLTLLPLPKGRGIVAPLLSDVQLPIYTVLVPVFRETAVLDQLISSLSALRYPQDKLDIKIILEAEDRPMHAAIKAMDLPWHFDIIIVPPGKPQTKPRALNYAMQFARGSLATIYDAEDQPSPTQLLLSAAQFAQSDRNVACLQAALDFENVDDNWLTRHFAAEYAGLFHVILPTLAAYGLPIPLGGTSNHFRVSALRHVCGWDPYNVTEDADLGIRLARHGFKTGILHSSTLEEANSEIGNWLKQRRRWLKGFLQTWLVHMRNPVTLLRETGLRGFLAIQATTLGVFASALLHPILLALTIWQAYMFRDATSAALAAFGLAMLLACYGAAYHNSKSGLRRMGLHLETGTALTIPAYWFLMSIAAWIALWDFIVAPFHWHKTRHGLARKGKPTLLRRRHEND